MAKDIIDNAGSLSYQDESTDSANARAAQQAENTANQYKIFRTSGYYDEDTNQQTKTTYGSLGNQLDMLYKDIAAGKFGDNAKTGAWYLHIKAVKDTNPKG